LERWCTACFCGQHSITWYVIVFSPLFIRLLIGTQPLYFEAAKNLSATASGVALFPWTFTTAPAAVITGVVVGATGKYRWGIRSGWSLSVVGIGLLALYKADTPAKMWIPIALISGTGLGILYSANSFAIQASSSNEDLPFAAALYSFFRSFGQMLGVGIGGAIFQNQMKHNLMRYSGLAPQAEQLSRDASALVETIRELPIQQAVVKAELIASYVDSLRTLWLVMTGLAVVALVLTTLFTKAKSLERNLETDQGFVTKRRRTDDEM
jgi:fucose permease